MKKLLLFVTMAASLLFTQCKKEESVSSAGKTVRMTVTAGPGSKTDITDAGAITWSTGDKLYVGDGSKYIGYLTLVGEGGSATGVFSGNVTLTTGAEVDYEETEGGLEPEPEDESGKGDQQTFYFFYLGSVDHTSDLEKDPTFVGVNFSNQNIQKGKEGEPLQNASGFHVGYGKANGTVTEDGMVTDINVRMVSKVALAHFNIKKDDVAYGNQLILRGDNICNNMKVNFNSAEFSCEGIEGTISYAGADGNGDCYVMLVPTSSTTGPQTLTFTNTDGDLSGTAILDNILPNKFYGKDTPIPVTLESTKVPVESVSLDKNSLSLKVGESETLTATVLPENATDKSVTWSVSTTGVVTVENGVVTAVGAGTATITVAAVDDDSKFATCDVTVTAPSYLPGEFTINSGGTKVKFSKGNLWWDGKLFHFEENQWGTQPASSGQWVSDHVSHFKWSDAANAVTGNNTYAGTLFCASNFTVDGEAGWSTLSKDEWTYLINTRSGNKFAKAKVNGVTGLLIFPDNYSGTTSGNGIATVNSKEASYPGDNIPDVTWASMESLGVVFLPAAGYRDGTGMIDVGSGGYYWSSTNNGASNAYYLNFTSGIVAPNVNARNRGYSVRLVRDAE